MSFTFLQADALLSGPKHNKAVMCLTWKIHVRQLYSGMSYNAVGCELNTDESMIYNKVSLLCIFYTHKTRLCIENLTKMLRPEAPRNLILYSP